MGEQHAPKELKLQLYGKLNATLGKVVSDYRNIITSLDIEICVKKDIFLKPALVFGSLESLTLRKIIYVSGCETMLTKHASKLRYLRLPSLPVLVTLVIGRVYIDTILSIIKQCRKTLTSLEVDLFPDGYDTLSVSNNDADFYIPNLNNLVMKEFNTPSFNFVTSNANNLCSLSVDYVPWTFQSVLPEFSKLRELDVHHFRTLIILDKIRDNLECMVFSPDLHQFVRVLPSLTDLYMIPPKQNDFNVYEVYKVLADNHQSLEFIYISGVDITDLDGGLRMENVERVVMGSLSSTRYLEYSTQDRDKMAMLCPNAKVDIINEKNKAEIMRFVRSRKRKKAFNFDGCKLINNQFN